MPYMLQNLVINRVDLVDEGANSAAFIEVFKRKERFDRMDFSEILSKLKPEHAETVQKAFDDVNAELAKERGAVTELTEKLEKANDNLTAANQELEVLKAAKPEDKECKECKEGEEGKEGEDNTEKGVGFDETEVLKSMPEAAREMFIKMREQKEAAEAEVRKAAEEKVNAEAVAKAATMKSLPIEQSKLVSILKSCDEEVHELLKAASDAIDAAVLSEFGKASTTSTYTDAWDKIDAKADEIAKRDSITKQKAISIVLKENPELYREYLNGGSK